MSQISVRTIRDTDALAQKFASMLANLLPKLNTWYVEPLKIKRYKVMTAGYGEPNIIEISCREPQRVKILGLIPWTLWRTLSVLRLDMQIAPTSVWVATWLPQEAEQLVMANLHRLSEELGIGRIELVRHE